MNQDDTDRNVKKLYTKLMIDTKLMIQYDQDEEKFLARGFQCNWLPSTLLTPQIHMEAEEKGQGAYLN